MPWSESRESRSRGKCLFKLFQVSDIHFGDSFKQQIASQIGGWEIHDPHVISCLASSIQKEVQWCEDNGIKYRIVCSGDLTTWGTPNAIRTACDFLSNRPVVLRKGTYACLPDIVSYQPGNHDVWDGWFPGFVAKPNKRRTELASYDQLYEMVAPDAERCGGDEHPFPYCQTIFDNEDLLLRLYALDSTRIDLVNPEELSVLRAALEELREYTRLTEVQIRWLRQHLLPNLSDDELRHIIAAIAVGFVDEPQLIRLARYCHDEKELLQDNSRQLIRIGMIHHPIAYPETPSNLPDWTPDPLRGLHSLGLVQAALQQWGFYGILCGHQHRGFIQEIHPSSELPPLYVFSCGTSGQRVSLPSGANQILRKPPDTLTEGVRLEREAILNKVNEYVVYELSQDSDQYFWNVRAARYLPYRDSFIFQDTPDELPLIVQEQIGRHYE